MKKIYAYNEIFASRAQRIVGDIFDYAINDCGIDGNDFVGMFLVSKASRQIEIGNAAYIRGKSGIEIAQEIIQETTSKEIDIPQIVKDYRTPEYWIGYVIAYYQWYSDRKFEEIFGVVNIETLRTMYITLHEADISKFVEIIDYKIKSKHPDTKLKKARKLINCTQRELALRSGVSLRSIQMYEQRKKDINKASVETVYRLAKCLYCSIEDLIEK